MADERFRGLRLDIATVLNGNWRTLYETATAMGRRSGDIQKSLRQMTAEGVVEAEHDEPEPGTRFRLNSAYEDALAKALRADQLSGLVQADQDLLLLTAPSRRAIDSVFARGELAVVVSWMARLGGTAFLAAVAPKASEADYGRLVGALEAEGIGIDAYRSAAVMSSREIRAVSIAGRQSAAGVEVEA